MPWSALEHLIDAACGYAPPAAVPRPPCDDPREVYESFGQDVAAKVLSALNTRPLMGLAGFSKKATAQLRQSIITAVVETFEE